MTYDVGNPSLGLGKAQSCGGVKPVNGIPTIKSNMKKKKKTYTNLITLKKRDHILSQK